MADYENTQHKIKKLFEDSQQNTNQYENLKSGEILTKSVLFQKNKNLYLLDDSYNVASSMLYEAQILLEDFPSFILPYLKVVVIFNTDEANWEDANIYNSEFQPGVSYTIVSKPDEEENDVFYLHLLVSCYFRFKNVDATIYLYVENVRDNHEIRANQ